MYRLGELNASLLDKVARKFFKKPTNESLRTTRLFNMLGTSTFYYGNITLEPSNGTLLDTFVRFDGWTKVRERGTILFYMENLIIYWCDNFSFCLGRGVGEWIQPGKILASSRATANTLPSSPPPQTSTGNKHFYRIWAGK